MGATEKRRFGELVKLPATAAGGWTHEAHDFTPWLAENLQLLGLELGLTRLELREREHPVGRYSLDLLLEDEQGRLVAVENQFGQTDHDHLGKLLTYCAGVGADVAIWIAESFTEEHVAALERLNDRTVEGVGFFGVKLELLRIGASLPAPHFRVVVQPNDWTKRVRSATRADIEWSWDAFAEHLRVPAERLAVGEALASRLEEAIDARGLPWQPRFRKGYVGFQRPGNYNVVLVDLYWNRAPRLSVRLPAPPDQLGLEDPYPGLEQSWLPAEGEWGWTIPRPELIPDVGALIDLVRPFNPATGPLVATPLPSV